MNAVGFLVLGITVSFNFLVLIAKYKKKRYLDATLDTLIFAIICFLFSGTFSSLVLGTIASAAVSIYLYFQPVKLLDFTSDEEDEWVDDEEDCVDFKKMMSARNH